MKFFNNLRHRVVKKLIRPEDGYTYTGFIEGGPIKFYYQEDEDKYILALTSEAHYLAPTLTGWTDYYTYGVELKEIEFKKWMHGVLSNVCDQYFERLESLSTQEIKHLSDYKKDENEGDFVINKESFCEIMEGLDKYWSSIRKLEDILNVYFDNNMMTEIFDTVINALEEDLEPDVDDTEYYPIIFTWLFDFDAGRNDKAKEGIDGHSLTNAGELYDYLIWKRDEKNISETP